MDYFDFEYDVNKLFTDAETLHRAAHDFATGADEAVSAEGRAWARQVREAMTKIMGIGYLDLEE